MGARDEQGLIMSIPASFLPNDDGTGQPRSRHGEVSGRVLVSVPAPSTTPRPTTLRESARQLGAHRAGAERDVDRRADERHRARGKLTARERIECLLDAGSFTELNLFARHRASGFGMERQRPLGDGVVAGWGTVDGRTVCVYAHDARVFGGALGQTFAEKIHSVLDLAASIGAPVIGLNDGGGARIQEGVAALAGFGGIFRRHVQASGVVPQISVIQGACAGGAVYAPALTDYVVMVKDTANMFITGPDVVRAVTGAQVTHDQLGGAATHAARTGVAAFVADDEDSAFEDVRYLLSFLPSNNQELPPQVTPHDDPRRRCQELLDLVPADDRTPYDMCKVIESIVDDGEYFEVHQGWARNIVCAFARLDGQVVGIVGNQPLVLAGVLDIDASEKAARFVRSCDAFNIPLVTLVDVPGFLPGVAQEHGGIIRHGAKLLYAFAEATVPKVTVITRKAYGGAYDVMSSKHIRGDINLAWPAAEIAVMGPKGAVEILFKRELDQAADREVETAKRIAEYTETFANPYMAASRGYVDDVIDPRATRRVLVKALTLLRTKRADSPARKHGNIPL